MKNLLRLLHRHRCDTETVWQYIAVLPDAMCPVDHERFRKLQCCFWVWPGYKAVPFGDLDAFLYWTACDLFATSRLPRGSAGSGTKQCI